MASRREDDHDQSMGKRPIAAPRQQAGDARLSISPCWILHGIGAAPVEAEPEMIDGVGAQLERLKSLHAETGHLIRRIQGDLDRLSAAQ